MISYKERDLLGGYSIAVMVNQIQVGSIRRHGSGETYSYFEGSDNVLTPSLTDLPLEELKGKIEELNR